MPSADVSVIVPVLNRPQNVAPLAASLARSKGLLELELVFVVSQGDTDELAAISALAPRDELPVRVVGAPWPAGIRGDYARKINLGLWTSEAPFVLAGADDLKFGLGWADAAVDRLVVDDTCFCGTNDLANPLVKAGEHATHPVVRRSYALECGTVDTPGLIYHEGYWHQYVDNEATATAMSRGCYTFEPDAVVEHLHPIWRTAPDDETYRLGQRGREDDRAMFRERSRLWG